MAWSADGARLYAGEVPVADSCPVVIWQDEGRGKRAEAPLTQSTIMQLLPCGDGIAAGADDPAFGLIAADGGKRVWREGVTADMRGKRATRSPSRRTGRECASAWGMARKEPVLFDLAAFRLADAPQYAGGFAPPQNLRPRRQRLGRQHRAEAERQAPSRLRITRPRARSPSRRTPPASCSARNRGCAPIAPMAASCWQKPVPGVAWGVNIGGNGKLVVAAYADGTIRWHRLADGQELLALFVHAKDRRYIAWTPQGYYAASPGGEDLIGWHVNRGFDAAPDFYPASTFASPFNRPDIVKAALDV